MISWVSRFCDFQTFFFGFLLPVLLGLVLVLPDLVGLFQREPVSETGHHGLDGQGLHGVHPFHPFGAVRHDLRGLIHDGRACLGQRLHGVLIRLARLLILLRGVHGVDHDHQGILFGVLGVLLPLFPDLLQVVQKELPGVPAGLLLDALLRSGRLPVPCADVTE